MTAGAASEAFEADHHASGGALAVRWALDVFALILAASLAWVLLTGMDRIPLGIADVTLRHLERPLRALAVVLVARHLAFGPGWLLDAIVTPLVRNMTAPFAVPVGAFVLWVALGAASGAARVLHRLMDAPHFTSDLVGKAALVGAAAAKDGGWALVAGVPAALVVWGVFLVLKRFRAGPAARLTALHVAVDLFVFAATWGPWARRAHRWILPETPRLVPSGVMALLIALGLLFGLAFLLSALRRPVAAGRIAAGLVLAAVTLGAAHAASPAMTGGGGAAGGESARRILLMSIDTLRADRLGCYGYGLPTSPNIDRFSALGARFDRAYCTMPTTNPSHSSMLTGTYPREHGVLRNGTPVVEPDELYHLAEFLGERGFATAAITSVNHLHPEEIGLRGFEYYSVPAKGQTRGDKALDRALKWLEAHPDDDVFLFVHMFDPHFPYDPPAEFAKRFVDDYRGTIDRGDKYTVHEYSEEELEYVAKLYDAEIAYTDTLVAQLVDTFLALPGGAGAPLVIITSDHGEVLLELKDERQYVFSHGYYLNEPMARVPLIVIEEDRVPAGLAIDRVVQNFSVAPTVAEWADPGAALPDFPARSLWPLLDGAEDGSGSAADDEAATAFVQRRYFEFPPRNYLEAEEAALIRERWKLIRNVMRGPELYDLEADPPESVNVAKDEPERAGELLGALDAWGERFPISEKAFGEIPESKIDELRALGYVQ